MASGDDDILARELAKATELTLGRILPIGIGKAAAIGAAFSAGFLPTETCTEKLHLGLAPEKVLELGLSVLTKLGKLQTEDGNKSPYPMLKAIVGSGFLNMNPAVVYLEILKADATGCELTITAAAKEGLIKQHTASKALEQVVSALRKIATKSALDS